MLKRFKVTFISNFRLISKNKPQAQAATPPPSAAMSPLSRPPAEELSVQLRAVLVRENLLTSLCLGRLESSWGEANSDSPNARRATMANRAITPPHGVPHGWQAAVGRRLPSEDKGHFWRTLFGFYLTHRPRPIKQSQSAQKFWSPWLWLCELRHWSKINRLWCRFFDSFFFNFRFRVWLRLTNRFVLAFIELKGLTFLLDLLFTLDAQDRLVLTFYNAISSITPTTSHPPHPCRLERRTHPHHSHSQPFPS